MSYIITDDKHYKNIANSIRSKMQTDREYYPEDMAVAIDNIPSSADGTDNPVTGIYFLNPNENGYPTKIKISGWNNPLGGVPNIFTYDSVKIYIKQVDFKNCIFNNISDGLFYGCINLQTINLPDGLKIIDSSSFRECYNLVSIKLPESLTTIGRYAFQYDTSLTTVNLPNNLIEIGSMAFRDCPITTLTFPNTLSGVMNDSFIGCNKLKYISFQDEFNCNNLNLSYSTLYTRETIVSWLNALADRTEQTAYKLTIGATNLAKLTEEDILIATNKNWTLA